jgi:6-pyruvoyl-tetrahydropterin synthase
MRKKKHGWDRHTFRQEYRLSVAHWNAGFGDRPHSDYTKEEFARAVHGHNVKVEVTLTGTPPNSSDGGLNRFMVDEIELKQIVMDLDFTFHPYHPKLLEFVKRAGLPPRSSLAGTQETVAMYVADWIMRNSVGLDYVQVRVYEFSNQYVEFSYEFVERKWIPR